jgi:hypothetical protein
VSPPIHVGHGVLIACASMSTSALPFDLLVAVCLVASVFNACWLISDCVSGRSTLDKAPAARFSLPLLYSTIKLKPSSLDTNFCRAGVPILCSS